MPTDEEVRIHFNTHDWFYGSLWECKKCGQSTIGLGMWGDDSWRSKHRGWEKPCPGAPVSKEAAARIKHLEECRK